MKRNFIDVLSHDEEYNTIFARGVSGSVALDIIPTAIAYLKMYPKFDKMYLQDYTGVEFIIDKQSTIESAIEAWQRANDLKRGILQFPMKKVEKSSAGIQPQNG